MGAWDFVKKAGRYIPGVAQVEAGLDGNLAGAANPFQSAVPLVDAATGGSASTAEGYANKAGRYVPGIANDEALLNGDWSGAINPFKAATNVYDDVKGAVRDAAGNIVDAYNAPFDEKRRGYDAVAERAEQIKQERMARKDKTYAMAEEKYRPTREALAAVYGDPKTWKL